MSVKELALMVPIDIEVKGVSVPAGEYLGYKISSTDGNAPGGGYTSYYLQFASPFPVGVDTTGRIDATEFIGTDHIQVVTGD
ncbi:MAG TPA: hypothetical protein VLZ84_09935 [Asticcacaulis sp.]|nr:hypothetical protein [Asticcacaulis sp.]